MKSGCVVRVEPHRGFGQAAPVENVNEAGTFDKGIAGSWAQMHTT